MFFSVLISNYNNSDFLVESINSVIFQNFDKNEYEIIVCDDFSTDDSLVILNKYSTDNKIKLLKNNLNYGVGYTKRKLVENSVGKWFLFLDSDDILKSNCLKTFHAKICELNSGDFSFLYANSDYLNYKGELKDHARSKEYHGTLLDSKFDYPVFHPVVYNRNLYNRTEGINVNLRSADDFDLWYKMEEKGRILFLRETLYTYRLNLNGVSQVGFNNVKWFEVMIEHALVSAAAANRRNLNQRKIISEFAQVLYQKKLFSDSQKNKVESMIFGLQKKILSFFE